MVKVLLIIAQHGFRDEELFDTKTALEKEDIEVEVASITTEIAKGKMGGSYKPDIAVKDADADDYEYIVLIGGPGAPALGRYGEVMDIIKKAKHVAAICIAPTILAKAGLLIRRRATVWESEESVRILEENGAEYTGEDVTIDDDMITGNGPKAAKKFGEAIARKVKESEKD